MQDFTAIDLETANNERSPVCSVGIVIVCGGEILDKFYSLIKLEYYNFWYSHVHRLTACLWHTSFYGFVQRPRDGRFYQIFNNDSHGAKLGKIVAQMGLKCGLLLVNKQVRKHILESCVFHQKEGRSAYSLLLEEWNVIENHREYCNRSKRKRDYRLAQVAQRFWDLDE